MRAAERIGLAAPQIGLSLQLFVIDVRDKEHPLFLMAKLSTPTPSCHSFLLMRMSLFLPGENDLYRGLSFFSRHHWRCRASRKSFQSEFRDADGAPHTLECEGILARCIQHEHDHCQGVLFIDRMTPAQQLLVSSKIKKLKKKTLADLKKSKS
jgi:peptide deformylase